MLLRLAERLDDIEVVFGSESILSQGAFGAGPGEPDRRGLRFRRHADRSQGAGRGTVAALGRAGRQLLDRVVAGSLRFRLLRGRPSHEKLYLLSGPSGSRVLTGSANLSRAAFEGWQHEILVVFDGEPAWRCSTAIISAIGRTACRWSRMRWSSARRRAPAARRTAAARRGADRAGAVGRGRADRSAAAAGAGRVCGRGAAAARRRSAPNSRISPCRRTRPAAPSSMRARCCA